MFRAEGVCGCVWQGCLPHQTATGRDQGLFLDEPREFGCVHRRSRHHANARKQAAGRAISRRYLSGRKMRAPIMTASRAPVTMMATQEVRRDRYRLLIPRFYARPRPRVPGDPVPRGALTAARGVYPIRRRRARNGRSPRAKCESRVRTMMYVIKHRHSASH
jgi:hypothetical protein